jgi:hypothetical protein
MILMQLIMSGLCAASSAYFLFNGRIPLRFLSALYLFYAISTIILIHAFFFAWDRLRTTTGKGHLSKNVPRYLDYGYTAIVTLSLFQIFFYGPKAADYVAWFNGSETQLAAAIKKAAVEHVTDDCPNKGTRTLDEHWFRLPKNYNFTETYCAKLKKLVDAEDVLGYIESEVIPDRAFVTHKIADDFSISSDGSRTWSSPIEDLVSRLTLVKDYRRARTAEDENSAVFTWWSMLLLPVGIALRLTKTSLELFVELK